MIYNLDLWDKKIIYELDKDARVSYSQIAKKIGKNKSFVINRINSYFKNKIFLQYLAVVDTSKLGYLVYDIYLKVINNEKKKIILDYLMKKDEVNNIQELIGKFQIYLTIFVKSAHSLELFKLDLVNKYGDSINDCLVLLRYRTYSPAHNYLYEDIGMFPPLFQNEPFLDSPKADLTSFDLDLLGIIDKNPRISIRELSLRTKKSFPIIKSLISKYKKEKVLLFVRPSINAIKLGFIHKNIFIRLIFSKIMFLKDINNFLITQNSTIYLSSTQGEYHITGELVFKEVSDFNKFHETLNDKYGFCIEKIDYIDYLEEYKYYYTGHKE
jgi:DNA-binding Lrp family transcriptional regulator